MKWYAVLRWIRRTPPLFVRSTFSNDDFFCCKLPEEKTHRSGWAGRARNCSRKTRNGMEQVVARSENLKDYCRFSLKDIFTVAFLENFDF